MIKGLNFALFLIGINFLAENLGRFSSATNRFYGIFFLLLFTLIAINERRTAANIPEEEHNAPAGLLKAGLLLIIGFLSPFIFPDFSRVMLAAFIPAACYRITAGKNRHYAALTYTALFLGMLQAFSRLFPWFWNIIQDFSYAFSCTLGDLFRTHVCMGATYSGFWAFVSVSALCLSIFILSKGAARLFSVLAFGYNLFIWILSIAFGHEAVFRLSTLFQVYFYGNPGGMKYGSEFPDAAAVFVPLIYLLVAAVPVIYLLLKPPTKSLESGKKIKRGLTAATALSFLTAGLVFGFAPFGGETENPKITFNTGEISGWEVPTKGRYGIISSGMFGMLPRYLHASGFRTEIQTRQTNLSLEEIKESSVYVIINPDWYFSEKDKKTLETYVEEGGSLMVMGDHTDVGGTMDPLNDLLEPVKTKFRFDSAFTSHHWHHDLEIFPHPATGMLDNTNERLQQSTGASLWVRYPSYPVISGKYAFSDVGDRMKPDNAFLGDYYYQLGEPLGDLPVVAEARKGRGKVIVFGDTTPLQNNVTFHSHEFFRTLFHYLSRPGLPVWNTLQPWAGAFFFIVSVVLLVLSVYGSGKLWTATVPVLIFAAAFAAANALTESRQELSPLEDEIAMVDASHVNFYTSAYWEESSLVGLPVNLARNGYLPVFNRTIPIRDETLTNVKFFISVAPMKSYSEKEIQVLHRYMEKGGFVILSVGYEEKHGSENLLKSVELDVSPIPLGPIPIIHKTLDQDLLGLLKRSPHFMEAWPIINLNKKKPVQVLHQDRFNYPVVAFRPVGKGGFTLIADTRYLYDVTLEAEKVYWDGNVDFIRKLLKRLDSKGI